MSKTLLPIIMLAAVLTVPATAARAQDDNSLPQPSWLEDSNDNDRYVFDRNRDDDRIINDTRRNRDTDFGNNPGNGRSGNRTLGQSVTDQLNPIGR